MGIRQKWMHDRVPFRKRHSRNTTLYTAGELSNQHSVPLKLRFGNMMVWLLNVIFERTFQIRIKSRSNCTQIGQERDENNKIHPDILISFNFQNVV